MGIRDWTPQSAQNDGAADVGTGKRPPDMTNKSPDYINNYNSGYKQGS